MPLAARTDELWIVKDRGADALLGAHGKRSWEAPRREERLRAAANQEFEPWQVMASVSSPSVAAVFLISLRHRRLSLGVLTRALLLLHGPFFLAVGAAQDVLRDVQGRVAGEGTAVRLPPLPAPFPCGADARSSSSSLQPDGCGELPLWQCDPSVKAKQCDNALLSPWQCGN